MDIPHPTEDLRDRFVAEVLPLRRGLYFAALRLAGNQADAEDLLQEMYLRVQVAPSAEASVIDALA